MSWQETSVETCDPSSDAAAAWCSWWRFVSVTTPAFADANAIAGAAKGSAASEMATSKMAIVRTNCIRAGRNPVQRSVTGIEASDI
ncbi:hypothetical protein NP284_39245 [Rhodopseudomonas pseudopalustris]|uniref:hypothetical protein n=1 Tax=Rhodopseudomonas pseudopalustris TaxID=1513892 RepID=UPI003F967B0E